MSKGLEAFYYLMNIYGLRADGWKKYQLVEKSLKALDIIKREMIDIVALISSENLFMYNTLKRNVDTLTQEEFDLLKEVL